MKKCVLGTCILFTFQALVTLACGFEVQSQQTTSAPAVDSQEKDTLPDKALMGFCGGPLRPGARVKQLTFSPDGHHVASLGNSLSREDRFSIWDVKTGQEVFTASLQESRLGQQAWCGKDASLLMFEDHQKSGRAGFRIINAKHSPEGQKALLAFAPSGSSFQTFSVAVAPGGNPLPPPETFSTFHFSPSNELLFAFRSGGMNPEASVVVFQAAACDSGEHLKRTKEFKEAQFAKVCTGLAWAPLTKTVLLLTDVDEHNQTAFILDFESGQVRKSFPASKGTMQGTRQTFDFSRDGKRLAIGKEDGVIEVFDTATGKLVLAAKKHDVLPGGNRWQSAVSAVKFVRNGQAILSAGRDESQLVWEADSGKDIAALNGHHGWVEAIAVSADERLIATAGQDSLIRLWDAQTWKPILPPQGHFGSIWNLITTADGKWLITDGGDRSIRFWDIVNGKEMRSVPIGRRWTKGLLMTPQGEAVLHQGENQDIVRIDMQTSSVSILPFRGTPLAFSLDGQLLATAVDNGTKVWNWSTRQEICLVPQKASSALFLEGNKLLLGVTGNNQQESLLVDALTGKELKRLPFQTGFYRNMLGRSIEPDRIYTCSNRNTVAQFSLSKNTFEREFEKAPTQSSHFYIIGFTVSGDGRLVATGTSDGAVVIYEAASGQIRDVFRGHREGVFTVAFTPDNRRVVSAGEDHSVLMWDVSLQRLRKDAQPFGEGELNKAWEKLGIERAASAKSLMVRFLASPQESVAFLRTQLKPATESSADLQTKLQQIVNNLDSSSFSTRVRADKELNELGSSAFEDVSRLAKNPHSPEVTRRLASYLARFETLETDPNNVREARAIEILEATDSPEARQHLKALSQGAKSAIRTKRAEAALDCILAAANKAP